MTRSRSLLLIAAVLLCGLFATAAPSAEAQSQRNQRDRFERQDPSPQSPPAHDLGRPSLIKPGRPAPAPANPASPTPFELDIYVALEGPYDAAGIMSTLLRSNAPAAFPAVDPYTQSVAADPTLLASSSDIVDWVMVRVSSDQAPASTVAPVPALLLSDGSLVDGNGNTLVTNDLTAADTNISVTVWHRNHARAHSAGVDAQILGTTITVDLMRPINGACINPSLTMISGESTCALYAGDGTFAFDASNPSANADINGADKWVWQDQNGMFGVYAQGDYNIDGDVNGADKILWINNNGVFT